MSLSPHPPPERKLAERTEDPMHSAAWWAGGECSFPVCECVERCAMEPTRKIEGRGAVATPVETEHRQDFRL